MDLIRILVLFSFTCSVCFMELNARNERAVDLYTRECLNETCKYVLQVSGSETAPTTETSTASVKHDLESIKVLVGQIYQDVRAESAKNAAITRGLTASVISLTGELLKIQGRNNYTERLVSKIETELAEIKHNISSSLNGGAKVSQPVIVRPASPDNDLQKAFGVDCAALYMSGVNTSGVYTLQPDPDDGGVRFDAFCDMEKDGGGWTVIQRRAYGSDDFFRGWQSYKHGFGGLHYDFWLGLEQIHTLTKFGNTKLKINLHDWEGQSRYSEFSYVRVSDEADSYRIMAGKYEGSGGDPFHTQHYDDMMQGMKFSTFDQDNDLDQNGNCAMTFTSGWWFNNCFLGNLNGVWYNNSTYIARSSNGIIWDLWTEHPRGYSLKFVEMKLRPEHI